VECVPPTSHKRSHLLIQQKMKNFSVADAALPRSSSERFATRTLRVRPTVAYTWTKLTCRIRGVATVAYIVFLIYYGSWKRRRRARHETPRSVPGTRNFRPNVYDGPMTTHFFRRSAVLPGISSATTNVFCCYLTLACDYYVLSKNDWSERGASRW